MTDEKQITLKGRVRAIQRPGAYGNPHHLISVVYCPCDQKRAEWLLGRDVEVRAVGEENDER